MNPAARIVDVAECLIKETGFQKTTVADIARELQMSPANVYRFFLSRSEINVAVCRRLFEKIEAAIEGEIANSAHNAGKTLRNAVLTVSRINALRYLHDRRLHELFETAHNENWPIVHEHFQRMDKLFEQVITRGMKAGEFKRGEAQLAALLFRSICVKFCNPRRMAEEPAPAMEQVVDFCLASLTQKGPAWDTSPKLGGSTQDAGGKMELAGMQGPSYRSKH
ncbi:MAG: TetR/AcrR family transcriptional regulator [Methylocapsa sp.]|nr:TetR/AcrR family transcriptional regulator [Methylocapsa sp.]